MNTKLDIDRRQVQGIVVFSLKGFLDLHTAPEFESAIKKDIKGGKFRFIVDLSDLEYISSAGLGVFIGYLDEVQEQAGNIVICNVHHDKVKETLDLVSLGDLIEIAADLNTARERFR